MIGSTNLFDLVEFVSNLKRQQVRSHAKLIAMAYLYAFIRNVHPSSTFRPKITHIKAFKTIKSEASVFGGNPHPFYL
mgnify:FL=1